MRAFKNISSRKNVTYFASYMALFYGSVFIFELFLLVFVDKYNIALIEIGVAYLGFTIGDVFEYLA